MRFLRHAHIKPGDRVLVRVDFNIDFDRRGRIVDEYRIKNALPTIRWLRSRKARIVLLTHLGDPGPALTHKAELSTARILPYLSRALRSRVAFAPRSIGGAAKLAIEKLKPGGVALLENVRFEPGEVANDPSFAEKLAQLADLYVFDAFGVAHRKHASCAILPRLIESYTGLLIARELEALSRLAHRPRHPLALVLGGAKVATKLSVLRRFVKIADHILVGGALANSLLKQKGLSIGASFVDKIDPALAAKAIPITHPALSLPVDVLTAAGRESKKIALHAVGNVPKGEMILDIGPDTAELFSRIIRTSRMVFWNGPMGYIENPKFAKGTEIVARAIARSNAFKVVGGGDTLVLLHQLRLLKKFNFVSTGGGAMLAFLAGQHLPALEALGHYKK